MSQSRLIKSSDAVVLIFFHVRSLVRLRGKHLGRELVAFVDDIRRGHPVELRRFQQVSKPARVNVMACLRSFYQECRKGMASRLLVERVDRFGS